MRGGNKYLAKSKPGRESERESAKNTEMKTFPH